MMNCCKSYLGKMAIWGDPTQGNPINTIAPVASNEGDDLLSTTNGTWSNDPNLFKYAWYKNNVLIIGAINKTYQAITPGTYKVRVTAYNINGNAFQDSNNVVVP